MRTIQVRDIPEDAYDAIRRRASTEGKSLQSYMREQVITLARRPTKREAVQAIEDALAHHGVVTTSVEAIRDDRQADQR